MPVQYLLSLYNTVRFEKEKNAEYVDLFQRVCRYLGARLLLQLKYSYHMYSTISNVVVLRIIIR